MSTDRPGSREDRDRGPEAADATDDLVPDDSLEREEERTGG
jgi:hypothetical protein